VNIYIHHSPLVIWNGTHGQKKWVRHISRRNALNVDCGRYGRVRRSVELKVRNTQRNAMECGRVIQKEIDINQKIALKKSEPIQGIAITNAQNLKATVKMVYSANNMLNNTRICI
jgi:hypothetical protein